MAEDGVPILGAVQHDLDLLLQLLGLHQREDLEHLVERPESSRKHDERLCKIGKPELAHEEIVEFEVQTVRDVPVGPLLERQLDVQPDRFPASLGRAAAGGFHNLRAAAREPPRRFRAQNIEDTSPPDEDEHHKQPFDILAGSATLPEQIEGDVTVMEIAEGWRADERTFARLRQLFLLY